MKAVWDKLVGMMPASVIDWVVYAAIAAVTLIGLFRCLLPLWNTTRSMRRAIRRLQDHAGEQVDRPVWQEPRFMGKRLKGCWLRFLQNAEQLDRRGLPCAVEDYINDDTVTHGPGNAQLAELIPSLLTSLGILGTFMGMTQGLAGLNTSSTETMMDGIQTLINGMRFAFGTSVAGVSCSLVFNMLNRIAQGSSYRAIDDFVESFTQLAMQRPLDNDVQLICQNQDRNRLLGEVTETVSGRMAASIELAVGRAMHPVAASMDKFLMGATQAQIQGMQRIVEVFLEHMNASLNNQFLELGRTLSEVNAHEKVSLERVSATLTAAQSITGDVTQLHKVSTDIIQQFEKYIKELTVARQRDEGFEKSAMSLLESMQAAAKDQTVLISELKLHQESLSTAVSKFGKESGEAITAMRGTAEEDAKQLRAVSDGLAASCTAFTKSVGEISQSLTGFQQGMNEMTRMFSERAASLPADGTDGGTAEALSGMQTTVQGIRQTLEGGKQGEGA